jgi:hypothetical protein
LISSSVYLLKNTVSCHVVPCSSCVNRRFVGLYRLHLQGRKIRERGNSVSRWVQSTATAMKTSNLAFIPLQFATSLVLQNTNQPSIIPRLYEGRFIIYKLIISSVSVVKFSLSRRMLSCSWMTFFDSSSDLFYPIAIYEALPDSKFPWGRLQKQNTISWKYLLQQMQQVFSYFSTYSPPELRHFSYRGTNFCIPVS